MNCTYLVILSVLCCGLAQAEIPMGKIVPVKLPPPQTSTAEVTTKSEPPANPVAKAAGDLVEAAVVATENARKEDPLEEIKAQTAKLVAEREKIAAAMALEQQKLDEKLAPRKRALLELQMQMEEMDAKVDLADAAERAKSAEKIMELRRQSERLALESAIAKNEVDTEGYRMRQEESIIRRKTSALALEIELQQKETESRTYASGKAPAYLKEPLQGKKLILSDRTIALNGVITSKTADSMADRIAYFNNRDPEAPIFIVIDDCPGGSVMAGYKIIKAMHGSKAPVYTVVKSFAASMAACITTVSKRSFAYPNAVILHHQLSAGVMGNLTQQRESVQELEEWWRRLADPVAKKMGITRDEFITRMYKESSTGDWNEFADEAQKLGWVDTIVEEIEETALLRHPDTQQVAATQTGSPLRIMPPGHMDNGVVEAADERGKPIALLPRLNPMDAYWMYNPDGFFRMQ
ncbi:ATP-dependent Clp protease protease subunit [Prosthecobacter fusiformis]|uniref:ATP-dependent Clp protease protease subunit n=1 Tax=Prosthecobacter fusiformis TaxID=48464 RepID=A0A4R7RVS3_9BACT|nr:ATP-dependent Clp protease proteolytic subunit [Prosthecobacter fusiformis]TDU69379.1 ATP-dependent Clp protease protease subunit [Prosthecobacter fusiformis]